MQIDSFMKIFEKKILSQKFVWEKMKVPPNALEFIFEQMKKIFFFWFFKIPIPTSLNLTRSLVKYIGFLDNFPLCLIRDLVKLSRVLNTKCDHT